MPTQDRRRHRPPRDAGAIFDAALARGLKLPDGLSPEVARRFHVEHPPTEWTVKDYGDWVAHFGETWQARQYDPHWRALRDELIGGIGRQPFRGLDRFAVRCASGILHAKIIEALADALDALRADAASRATLKAAREFAECDLRDAQGRKGRHPEPWKEIMQGREAKASQAVADVRRMQGASRTLKVAQKEIMDSLTLDLFAVIRHVTPHRTVVVAEWVADRRIHAEAVTPLLRAFAKLSGITRTARDGTVQSAPRIRLHRWVAAEKRQSARAADIWRDGRKAETFEDILSRSRARLFAWDTRFDSALFENR